MSHRRICGIPCHLRNAAARRTLGKVLDRIRVAQPQDYARLVQVVRDIVPLSTEETEDGTLGEWKADPETEDTATWGYGYKPTPGVMSVNEDLPRRELIAVMAHELGHACTTQDDLKARQSPEDEWASEWAADWYAVKRWGFGAEIDAIRDTRAWLHHGPWPGETFTTETGEYYLDDDFVCHRSARCRHR